MKIEKLPGELKELVKKYKLNALGRCYMNSLGLVIQTRRKSKQANYVLATVTNRRGIEYPHAIINYGGKFHDPTLKDQKGTDDAKYTFIKQFSLDEIDELMKIKFSRKQIDNMQKGIEPYWSLEQIGINEFDFVGGDCGTIRVKKPSLKDRIISLFYFKK